MTESETLWLFGFGSLIFSPELADQVQVTVPGQVRGYRRAFNKRSRSRRCQGDQSFAAFAEDDPRFFSDGDYQSLVLGTVPDQKATMVGMVIGYPARLRDEVLRLTDAREGYVRGRASQLNGYLRHELRVERLDEGQAVNAMVYLSNPDPGHLYYVPPEWSLERRAQILVNATPRGVSGVSAERESRGLFYLEGVREGLRQRGIVDPDLEALAAAVRALRGPWVDLVQPGRAEVRASS